MKSFTVVPLTDLLLPLCCLHVLQVGISDASGQLLLWQVSSTSTSADPFLVRLLCQQLYLLLYMRLKKHEH